MSLYLKKDNGMLLQEYEGYRRHLFCKKVSVVFFIAEGTRQAGMLTFLCQDLLQIKMRPKGERIMLIKASASLRNDYATISALAKETKEPIYITKNGEGDLVLMSIDAFEKREQMLQLRARVLQAEQERIDRGPAISVSVARKRLRERAGEV